MDPDSPAGVQGAEEVVLLDGRIQDEARVGHDHSRTRLAGPSAAVPVGSCDRDRKGVAPGAVLIVAGAQEGTVAVAAESVVAGGAGGQDADPADQGTQVTFAEQVARDEARKNSLVGYQVVRGRLADRQRSTGREVAVVVLQGVQACHLPPDTAADDRSPPAPQRPWTCAGVSSLRVEGTLGTARQLSSHRPRQSEHTLKSTLSQFRGCLFCDRSY